MELTHIGENGEARMVDVSAKEATLRTASAGATVRMQPETLAAVKAGNMKKGDVLGTARIAGIMAAKRTHELIPLCHPLPLTGIEVTLELCEPDRIAIVCTTRCLHVTGVEMEALTGASVAALTVYDMCKAIDRGMEITDIRLLYKDGGKSGVFRRAETPAEVPHD